MLLDNVKVIAMGANSLTPQQPTATDRTTPEPQAANATPQFLVTVEVTPEQATKLIHGINNYTLYAGPARRRSSRSTPGSPSTDLTMLPGR